MSTLDQLIDGLNAERADLDAAIAALTRLRNLRNGRRDLATPAPAGKRRGRKSMGAAERLEVSRRMKRYWSDRQRQQMHANSREV